MSLNERITYWDKTPRSVRRRVLGGVAGSYLLALFVPDLIGIEGVRASTNASVIAWILASAGIIAPLYAWQYRRAPESFTDRMSPRMAIAVQTIVLLFIGTMVLMASRRMFGDVDKM
jgi:hypothetical protein